MVELKNKELENKVRFLSNKEDITLEDFLKIKSITLNPVTLDNEYVPIEFDDLQYFRNLESLSISNTKIDEEELKYIYTLPELKRLSLYDCSLDTLKDINYLKKLEVLEFSHLNYNDISSISTLSNLKELKIAGTNIDSLEFIRNLNLISLDISYSTISNLEVIKEMYTLQKLYIKNINIDINDIIKLPSILELHVSDDKVEEVKQLVTDKNIQVFGEMVSAGDDLDV